MPARTRTGQLTQNQQIDELNKSVSSMVKSVNGNTPDEAGNVETGSSVTQIAFTPVIPFSGITLMAPLTVSGPITFSTAVDKTPLSTTYVRIKSNGVNIPDFSALQATQDSFGWNNTIGVNNLVKFTYDGVKTFYRIEHDTVAPNQELNAVTIAANRVTGIAPLSVIFDGISTISEVTTNPFHDLYYTWDFGDTAVASTNWTYGAKAGTQSLNTDTGPTAGHLYRTPGTYTVTLDVFNGIDTYSKTVTITVTDPDVAYAGTETICIGQSSVPLSSDPGVPAGATLVQAANWTGAGGVISYITPGKRVLLRRGDSWTSATGGSMTRLVSTNPTRVGAFGTGAKPKITMTGANSYAFFWSGSVLSQFEFFDIDFVGTNNIVTRAINYPGNTSLTVVDCTSDLIASPLNLAGNDIFIQGNYFKDMLSLTPSGIGGGNIGIWIENCERAAIIGNRVDNARAIEHVIRTQGAGRAAYSHNSLSGPAPGKHVLAIRGKQSGSDVNYDVETRYVYINDNLVEAGTGSADRLIQVGPQAPTYRERIFDVIINGNKINSAGPTAIYSECQGTINIRNNIFLDVADAYIAFNQAFSNTNGVLPCSDSRFQNNSIYATGTKVSGVQQSSSRSTWPTGMKITNNLIYAPNATRNGSNSGTTPTIYHYFAPVLATDATLLTNSSDVQAKSTNPWASPPTIATSDWTPNTGSYAINSGTSIKVLSDFSETLRIGSFDLGAVNV